MKPEISIITPTFNHEKYIEKCIASVTQQTHSNWEQIIIDDASSDKTFEIVSKFAKNEKRIRVIRHKRRWGINKLADIYNQALKITKADYIGILEGDDFWPADKLENQLSRMKKTKAVLSFGDCIYVNTKGSPIKIHKYEQDKNKINNNPAGNILNLFASLNFSIIPVTVIIEKKTLMKIGGFQKDKYYPFTDIPTFLKLSFEGKFEYVSDILGYYRKHQMSSWFSHVNSSEFYGKLVLQKCINNTISKNNKVLSRKGNFKPKNIINLEKQNLLIKRKGNLKWFSFIKHQIAFNEFINLFRPIFEIQYLLYKRGEK